MIFSFQDIADEISGLLAEPGEKARAHPHRQKRRVPERPAKIRFAGARGMARGDRLDG